MNHVILAVSYLSEMLENELKKEEKRVRTIMQRFLIAHSYHLKHQQMKIIKTSRTLNNSALYTVNLL